MNVYLVRHGMALDNPIDRDRTLSKVGFSQVDSLVNFAKEKRVTFDEIYHSGLVRAAQTCKIIQETLAPDLAIQKTDHLEPNSDPSIWGGRIMEKDNSIMLVGHLPFMSKLANHLLGSGKYVEFQTANMASLIKNEKGDWVLEWMLKP
jgi:phosphohistidine phosphatase